MLREVGLLALDEDEVSSREGLEEVLEELLTVLRRIPNFSGSVIGVAGSFDGVTVATKERVIKSCLMSYLLLKLDYIAQ